MNAKDVLYYGHEWFLKTLDGLDESDWDTPGVCGVWSVREIVAHLASFEHVLVEVLERYYLDAGRSTPTLDHLASSRKFNDEEVAKRKDRSVAEVFAEYKETYQRNLQLIEQIPVAERRKVGALPWYGEQYDLEDYIAYQFYGHKREHGSQINVYRDHLKASASNPGQ